MDEMASPCLKVTIVKAKECQGDWGDDPIDWDEDPLNDKPNRGGHLVFSLRDCSMEPRRGVHRNVRWFQLTGTVKLQIPLKGPDWAAVTEDDFEVQLSDRRLGVKLRNAQSQGLTFAGFRGDFANLVNAFGSYILLEDDTRDASGRTRLLSIEVAKRQPEEPWAQGIFRGDIVEPVVSPSSSTTIDDSNIGGRPLFGASPLPKMHGVERFSWDKDASGEWKELGDKAFKSNDFNNAVAYYSRALSADPSSETLLSNRSAAYAKLGRFDRALHDAARAEELAPSWAKCQFRKAVALRGLRCSEDALAAFTKGRSMDVDTSIWDREMKSTHDAMAANVAKRGNWI